MHTHTHTLSHAHTQTLSEAHKDQLLEPPHTFTTYSHIHNKAWKLLCRFQQYAVGVFFFYNCNNRYGLDEALIRS